MVVAETVKFGETISVLNELIVNECRLAVFALTVTVLLPSIVTSSPVPGTLAPEDPPDVADQVAVLFQLPVATEKRVAASVMKLIIKINKIPNPIFFNPKIFPTCFKESSEVFLFLIVALL